MAGRRTLMRIAAYKAYLNGATRFNCLNKSNMNIDAYLDLVISSSFKKIFNHIIVKTGAELTIKVTTPEEMCPNAKIKHQPTVNTETNPVIDASLKVFESKPSLTNSK